MREIDIAVASMAALALVMGLFTHWIRLRWINEPLLALLLGVLIGPVGLGWLDLAKYGEEPAILEVTARFTLAIALVSVGLELRSYLTGAWRSLTVLVLAGMALTWGISSLLVAWILGLDPLPAILIGAVLTPVDPILVAAVTTGRVASDNVPERIRHLLSADSAARHGLGLMIVLLPALLITKPDAEAWTEWLSYTLLWKGLAAVAVGALIGYTVGRVHAWSTARRLDETATGPLMPIFYTLALLIVSGAELLESDGLLAVLAAGATFAWSRTGEEKGEGLERELRQYQHLLKQVLQVPVFALLGAALPWAEWNALGWPAVGLVFAVLLLRRIPTLLLLKPLIGEIRRWDDALFVGWFGPVGVGALYFASVAHKETQMEQVWSIGTLIIASTIVAHDVTATPLSQWLGRREAAQSSIYKG